MSIDKSISGIDRAIAGIEPVVPRAAEQQPDAGGDSFVSILRGQMDELVNLQDNAAQMQQALAAGQIDDLSQVVLAVQKADLALNFALQLRNKVVEAYQEVTRMQM
jgi:flagellar hook-basal body complex protein FliE